MKSTSTDGNAKADIQGPEMEAMLLEIRTGILETGDSEKFFG